MAWEAWDKVTCHREEGGLGLARLDECNKALVLKWCWRYYTEQNALWRKVVDAIHGSDRKWSVLPINNNVSGVWKNIAALCCKIKVDGVGVISMIRGRIGNGQEIRFWIDPWVCQFPLKDCYPDLFELETHKQCRVCDRCEFNEDRFVIKWRWKRAMVSRDEITHKEELEGRLIEVSFADQQDTWCWNDNKDDKFTVASAKRWLRRKGNDDQFGFKWCKWVPAKCNIFMWRAFLDRLPTKTALQRRNVTSQDDICVLCEDGTETMDHILTGCGLAAGVWNGISVWCRMPPMYAFSTKDLVHLFEQSGVSGEAKSVLHGIIIITSWRIWKARNERIFSSKTTKVTDIVSDVKVLGFLWYNNRARRGLMDWDKLCNFN